MTLRAQQIEADLELLCDTVPPVQDAPGAGRGSGLEVQTQVVDLEGFLVYDGLIQSSLTAFTASLTLLSAKGKWCRAASTCRLTIALGITSRHVLATRKLAAGAPPGLGAAGRHRGQRGSLSLQAAVRSLQQAQL